MRPLLVVLVAASLAACGGEGGPVRVTNDVSVTITPTPDALPFDPRSARLRAATDQLTREVGHPVAFQLDAAVASAFRADFERELVSAIERVVREVIAWKRDEPESAARTLLAFRRVECHYSALVKTHEATFDAGEGVLRVVLPARPESLVPGGSVYDAFFVEDDTFRDRAFSLVTGQAITPDNARAVFAYLVRTRAGYGSLYERRRHREARERGAPDELAHDPHAEVVLRVLRVEAVAKGMDEDLARKARAWLLEQLGWFHHAYGRADDLSKAGEGTPFRAAEAAYARWITSLLPAATAEERLRVVEKVYEAAAPEAFPGVDRFGLGLAVLDDWVRAGRPRTAGERDPRLAAMDHVLCPSSRNARGEHSRDHGCASAQRGFIAFAVATPERRARLAKAMDARDDDALAEQIFVTLRGTINRRAAREGAADPGIEVFRLLDPKGKSWRAAVDVFATDRDRDRGEIGRMIWSTQPARRGSALYLLAEDRSHLDAYYADNFWRDFARSFGAPVDRATLAAMLDHGPRAFALVPGMWLGLARSFGRADVLVPRLDALLPDATSPAAPGILRPLSAVISRLCDEKAAADLGAVHAYLAGRVRARPAEQRALAIAIRDTGPSGCKARTKATTDSDAWPPAD